MKKKNPLLQKSFQFSIQIIEYTEKLNELKKYNIANQLFRSGTSISNGAGSTKSRINK